MSRLLHLTIATPETRVVDGIEVSAVRAADESGSFGILPGHADLLTVLLPTVVRWRTADTQTHYCAVRGGIMTVNGGNQVMIACRNAHMGDQLDVLETDIHNAQSTEEEEDRRARTAQAQAHARAIRQMMRYLQPGKVGDLADILGDTRQ